jgi:hypothetical protein
MRLYLGAYFRFRHQWWGKTDVAKGRLVDRGVFVDATYITHLRGGCGDWSQGVADHIRSFARPYVWDRYHLSNVQVAISTFPYHHSAVAVWPRWIPKRDLVLDLAWILDPWIRGRPDAWDFWAWKVKIVIRHFTIDPFTPEDPAVPVRSYLSRLRSGSPAKDRIRALESLGKMGRLANEAVPEVEKVAATDPDPNVREAARRTLARIR